MTRIQEALAQLGYEQSLHVRHKHDLLQTIRHHLDLEVRF